MNRLINTRNILIIILLMLVCQFYVTNNQLIQNTNSKNENDEHYINLCSDKTVIAAINTSLRANAFNYSYFKLYPVAHIYEDSDNFFDYSKLQSDRDIPSLYVRLFKVYSKNPEIYNGNNTWIAGYIDLNLNTTFICENCWW